MKRPPTKRWLAATFWACALQMGLALLPVGGRALAQSNASGALPGALNGINPAGMSCLRDDAKTGQPSPSAPALPEPDLSCALAATEALSWLAAPDTLFVDTRLPPEHAQYGIPGALNMAALNLRSKLYLKSKRIVLFGNGKGEQENYRACAQLKAAGFAQARVLRGGLPMWQLEGQPLVGRYLENEPLFGLDAAGLFQESQFADNVVLVSPARRDIQASLTFSVLLQQPNAEAIRAVLERRRKELKAAPMAAVVLVAGKELSEAQFAQIQQALKPVPVLWYADGTEALKKYLARQQAMWAAQARGPKRPPCGT